MVPPRNLAIAAEFHRVADELESQHANPFRVRAYRQAARLIARLPEDAGELARRGELTKLKGIGKDLAQKVVLSARGGGSKRRPTRPWKSRRHSRRGSSSPVSARR